MAKRNKPLITASVSPYIKEQAEALVESGNFGSMSDLVSIALAEFIGKFTRDQKEKENRCATPEKRSSNSTYNGDEPIVIEHVYK
jgi:Arc/MetJ-type ribon-helix-helix transcriptional regulator